MGFTTPFVLVAGSTLVELRPESGFLAKFSVDFLILNFNYLMKKSSNRNFS